MSDSLSAIQRKTHSFSMEVNASPRSTATLTTTVRALSAARRDDDSNPWRCSRHWQHDRSYAAVHCGVPLRRSQHKGILR